MKHIALDGPLNGDYITPAEAAANDYELTEWTEGEQAYLHVPTEAIQFNEDGVPLEIIQAIEEAESRG